MNLYYTRCGPALTSRHLLDADVIDTELILLLPIAKTSSSILSLFKTRLFISENSAPPVDWQFWYSAGCSRYDI